MPFVDPVEIPGKPWGRETLLAKGPGYEFKRLVYEAGHQGALQFHPDRDETFHLAEGIASVTWILQPYGVPIERLMDAGQTFHVPPGTPHKFRAMTRCVVYEASNGEPPASVNVAEQYGDEDGAAR